MADQALEIVGGGPFTLYYGPASEPQPDIDDDEATLIAGNWTVLGLVGSESLDESGIRISHPQTVNFQRVLGSTLPRKAFRTQEDIIIEVDVLDLTAETYAHILGDVSVTTTPAGGGASGRKEFAPKRGLKVAQHSILFRAPSPEMDGGIMQWWVPLVSDAGAPAPSFVKGQGAALAVALHVLEDPSQADGEEIGLITIQTSVAS